MEQIVCFIRWNWHIRMNWQHKSCSTSKTPHVALPAFWGYILPVYAWHTQFMYAICIQTKHFWHATAHSHAAIVNKNSVQFSCSSLARRLYFCVRSSYLCFVAPYIYIGFRFPLCRVFHFYCGPQAAYSEQRSNGSENSVHRFIEFR